MRFTAVQLALRAGVTTQQVATLADEGLLTPDRDGTYPPGDLHRLRLIRSFQAAGVPLEVLLAAKRQGAISFVYYDQLHIDPGPPSDRSYGDFSTALGDGAALLPGLHAAFGLAEPPEDARLSPAEEMMLADLVSTIAATGSPDLAMRIIRLFGESSRRVTEAALGVYGDAIARLPVGPDGLPTQETYLGIFTPWARLARAMAGLAAWLTQAHLSRAIEAFSIDATERLLALAGHVAPRSPEHPGIGFVDLSGFTRLTERQGDEVAASMSLRLGDLARDVVSAGGGIVVKLLGDGVLLRYPDATSAVEGVLSLIDRLPAAGLPGGHAGVHAGPVVLRDGDVFGRTVNLAARIADVAPDGEVYVTERVASALPPDRTDALGMLPLQGIGDVPVLRVRRGPAPGAGRGA